MTDDKTNIKNRLAEWLPQLGYVEIEERRLSGYTWLLIAREKREKAKDGKETKGLAIHAYQLPNWPDFFEFRFEFVMTESDRDTLRRLNEAERKSLLLQLQARSVHAPGVSISYHMDGAVPTTIMVTERIAFDGFSKDRVIKSTETLRAVFGFAMMILDVIISPPTIAVRKEPIGPLN